MRFKQYLDNFLAQVLAYLSFMLGIGVGFIWGYNKNKE